MITKNIQKIKIINRQFKLLKEKKCWYVSCGRNVGSSFQLCLGEKIRRKKALGNKFHPKSFRENTAEYAFLVWCSWRLSKDDKLIVTSDDCDNHYKWCKYLRKLIGLRIIKIQLMNCFFDFKIIFNEGWQIHIFCDNGNKDPSIDTNWEIFIPGDYLISVGTHQNIDCPQRQKKQEK